MKKLLGELIGQKVQIQCYVDNSAIDIGFGRLKTGLHTIKSVDDEIFKAQNASGSETYYSISHIRKISFY